MFILVLLSGIDIVFLLRMSLPTDNMEKGKGQEKQKEEPRHLKLGQDKAISW